MQKAIVLSMRKKPIKLELVCGIKLLKSMATAGLRTGSGMFLKKPELLFGRTQQPKRQRFHYYTRTRATKNFLRIVKSLPIIY